MKKIISILIVLVFLIDYSNLLAASNYTLSAVVGNSNHGPVVTSVVPDLNPNYLEVSDGGNLVKQDYSIKFRDDEKDEVTYTITTETDGGAVNPTSGTILTTNYDVNNEAYITFEYISPTAPVGAKEITITISDGPNVTIKTLNVFIYEF